MTGDVWLYLILTNHDTIHVTIIKQFCGLSQIPFTSTLYQKYFVT